MDSSDSEKRDFGKEFEEEVKFFLEDKLKFSDVRGGQDFHIAPPGQKNQIDACGRYNDILFVFECKASGRRTKKNLRQDILATKERARMVLRSYKNIKEYEGCNYVKFIFITKKIELPDTEKDLLNKDVEPHFWYADENMLEYYSDLYEKVGEYATYNFLADFGIRPSEDDVLKVAAVKTKIGKYDTYSFYAPPKQLLKFSYVARRRSLKENFYQRMLDKNRIKNIQKFIDGGGVFPTNVIISLKHGDKDFVKDHDLNGTEIGILTIKNSYSACWIIDGQHRLYSHAKSKSENLIPCIAFDNIDIEDERRFFLEINREQKPIQPDLIWDLEGLSSPDSYKGIISNVVRTLNNREPFLDKVYIPVKGSRANKIVNMAAFCNGIANAQIVKQNPPSVIGMQNPLFTKVTRTMTNRTASALERFFINLRDEFNEDQINFVFGNAGIPIMLYIFEPILAHIGRIPNYGDLNIYTKLIGDFFSQHYSTPEELRKLRSETNSEGARKSIARQVGLYIRKSVKDRLFWPKMEQDEFVSEIILMERGIATLIAETLADVTVGWEKQRVPQSIYIVAKKRMDQDGTVFHENLSLGDELQIITRDDNWKEVFQKFFITKTGFKDQSELKLAFRYLSEVRNPASHGKSVITDKDALSQSAIYLEKFRKVIPIIEDVDQTATTDQDSEERQR